MKVSNLPYVAYWGRRPSYIFQRFLILNNESENIIQEAVECCPFEHNLLVQGRTMVTI